MRKGGKRERRLEKEKEGEKEGGREGDREGREEETYIPQTFGVLPHS